MAAIAEARGAQLDAYGRERFRSVSSLASAPAFTDAAVALAATYAADGTRDDAAYTAALEPHKAHLDGVAKSCEFTSMLLIDASGRVVYTTGESPLLHHALREAPLAGLGVSRAVERVRSDRATQLSPPSFATEGAPASLEVVGPLLKGDELVGFVAVTLDRAELAAIVSDYTGLGRTGDIVGVCRIGAEMAITTPTRADRDAAYTQRIKLGASEGRRLQELVYGSPFRGRGTDLAGNEVVGAWVRVPSLRWGLGVTQQVDEALALTRSQEEVVKTVAMASIPPVIVLALATAWSIRRRPTMSTPQVSQSQQRTADPTSVA